PAQKEPPAVMPARFEADGRGELDDPLECVALLGRDLAPREPRVEQNGQVLLVLLFELLDHRLSEPRRGPPVDPPRAVAGRILAGAVISLRRGRPVGALAGMSLRGLPLQELPPPRELADPRIDHELRGVDGRHPALDQPERRARDDVEHPETVLAALR